MAKPWERYAQPQSNADGPWAKYQKPESVPSVLDSAGRGLAQGASLGFADEIAGGAEALLDKAKGSDESLSDLYARHRDESRAAYSRAKEANPKSFAAGELGGAVGTAFIPGLGAASGAKLATVAGKAALQGGIAGVGMSESEDADQIAKDGLRGAVLGSGAGAAGVGISKGVSALAGSAGKFIADKSASKLNKFAEIKAAKALGLERGTLKKLGEDRVREIGRYALDEGVVTPLANTDKMVSRVDALKKLGGSKMDEVYSAIDDAGASTFNPLDTAVKVENKIGNFWRDPLNKGETNQFENTIESILMRGEKNIPIKEAQALKEKLGSVANWKNKINITDKERMARDAYGVVSDAIDQAVESGAETIQKAGLSDTLKRGKDLYSKSIGAQELLENKVAREQGNKIFNLGDNLLLGSGGTATLATMSPEVAAATAAMYGAKKVGEKYGNQMMATGANRLARSALTIPSKIESVGAPIQRIAPASSLNLNRQIRASNPIPAIADDSETSKSRAPSNYSGEDKWARDGMRKLGIKNESILSDKKIRQLLIEVSDLKPGSKRFEAIKKQLSQGLGE